MTTRACYAALALAVITACGPQVDAGNAPVSIPVAEKQSAPPALPNDAPSGVFRTVLYSEYDAEITARMNGVVKSVTAELGDAVSDATVLAVLEDDREAAAVQSAQAALDLARTQLTRAQALKAEQMVTQSDLDSVVYREKVADAVLRDAHTRLGYTRIRAPFAGRIAQRFVRVGQTVREGDPLFRVTALQPLRASVRLPEQQARMLASGADVVVSTLDGKSARGRVTRISPAVDAASGTVELLVDISQPGSMRPGSTVTVQIAPTFLRKASE